MNKKLSKKDISDILEEIGILLELRGENPFKSRAYSNAARIVTNLEGDLDELAATGALSEIRGIGEALSRKISLLVTTGELDYYTELKASVPRDHVTMLRIRGLGPKKIFQLHRMLGINTVDDLEKACREGRLLEIRGFGPKNQEKILKGIQDLKTYRDRHLYIEAAAAADSVFAFVSDAPELLRRPILTGSLRRRCAVVGDIDLIASSDRPSEAADYFASFRESEEIIGKGDTKISLLLRSGFQTDLRIIRENEYPYALHHFTGSKDHNTALRGIARKKGITMNEYGLFSEEAEIIHAADEEEIFAALGLSFIPPELRENTGEIEEAAAGITPRLIERADIRGAFHFHSDYSDGRDSISKLAAAAAEAGLEYIGISDHSRSAYYAGGMSVDDVRRQVAEIDALNSARSTPYIFKGIEVEILPDGRLDYEEDVLELFDFIIAAVHSHFSMPEAEMTARIIKALGHPLVTMLAHPSGRLLLSREPYALDMKAVIDFCAGNGRAIEINANPERLDLDWRFCRYARSRGVKLSINPDAHSVDGIEDLIYGVYQARKGRLAPADCLNTLSCRDVRRFLNNRPSKM